MYRLVRLMVLLNNCSFNTQLVITVTKAEYQTSLLQTMFAC